ncbi:serine/threonine-protein kinase [Nocardia yunnanensis]|uniref:serine/threonine-protein kinase n=1 Tax=Nocardia yunnanensis TaxID=2382165 RepID=UPI0013C41BC7|nr:serine/threonine-protein kinase [Nocardia yunnanensis]
MVGQLPAGVIFAGYRIERLLGTGGTGEVYLAHDRDLPRFVALKLLNSVAGDDGESRQRFLREANIIARLTHPNIVTIYARGEEQGRQWLAMAYVDGSDLAAELTAGPLDPPRAAAITADVARALDYAHEAGVLHRDVKPANILLTAQPREWALLTDFGIAESNHETRGITAKGDVLASFQYTAPERFHGEARVDRRADVYSLGCTLFQMLTGVPPFADGDLPQLIYRHVNAPVPAVRDLDPALPAAVDQVLARAMAKHPGDRFATCTEFADAVAAALSAPRPRAAGSPARTAAPRPRTASARPRGSAPPREAGKPRDTGRSRETGKPRDTGRHSAIETAPPWIRSRALLIGLTVVVVAGAGAAAVGLLSSLLGPSRDSSDAGVLARPSTVLTSRTTAPAAPSVTAAASLAADNCPSRRTADAVSGIGPGGTGSGPDAILGFQYAYYVLRSGTAARQFVAEDAAGVADAAKIQSGIDSVLAGTRYCVQVSRLAPADDDHWSVRITQQSPGELPDVYTQIVTTRTADARTLITSIVDG